MNENHILRRKEEVSSDQKPEWKVETDSTSTPTDTKMITKTKVARFSQICLLGVISGVLFQRRDGLTLRSFFDMASR